MELLHRIVGPIGTNVYVLADTATREAIAIDTATPCLSWLSGLLLERGWTLKLIVSTHGHWDHVGDNAAITSLALFAEDKAEIEAVIARRRGPLGDVYELERDLTGRHGSIMHYNNNAKTR